MDDDSVIKKYKELLNLLTTSSRDLINDLTNLSEQNTEKSEEIVESIETRIKKCLPRYKLFGFYLLDSIVKNVGSPYNTLFSNNLYQIFTESYLLVNDTLTRQYMIDLFSTWKKGVSTNGKEIFDKDLLDKIEQFIIRATTLNRPPSVPVPAPTSAPASQPKEEKEKEREREEKSATPLPSQINQFQLPSNITPDHFHREFNLLLQFIIKLNSELEEYADTAFSKRHLRVRNGVVSKINDIDELIVKDSRTEFGMKVNFYHKNVIEIRSLLDQESLKQTRFILKHAKPIKPNPRYIGLLKNIFEPVEEIDQAYEILDEFGVKVNEEEIFYYNMKKRDNQGVFEPLQKREERGRESEDDPLGLGFDLGDMTMGLGD